MAYAASYHTPSYQPSAYHSTSYHSPSYHSPSYHTPSYHSPSYHSHPSYYASHPYHSSYQYEPSHHYPMYHHKPYYGHNDYGHHGYGHEHGYGNQGYGHHASSSHGHGHHEGGGLVSAASLLIPLLGLIGLSLLVPNVVGLRAKRETDDDQRAQKLMDMYTAVLSSENCIQKLFCEMGHLAKNSKDQQGLFKLMERVVPPQFEGEFNILKESTRSPISICSKYMCNIAMPQQPNPSTAQSSPAPAPSLAPQLKLPTGT